MSGMAGVALLLATLGGTPDGVVLDFSAEWCGPCQSMAPIVERLQRQGYAIRKVDFDSNQKLAAQYGVTHLPTFVLVVDGQVRQRYTGPMSEADLRRMAASIPTKKDPAPVTNSKSGSQPPAIAATRPAVTRPAVTRPTVTRPAVTRPAVTRPTVTRPTVTRPAATTDATKTGPPRSDQRVVRANDDVAKNNAQEADPIAVCARIRVHLGNAVDMGSGTVIHSEPGKTFILTCGHIFRGFDANSRIEVDLFNGSQPQTYDAKLIKADLDADIGLISLNEVAQFPVSRIAARSTQRGHHVYSIGCGGGSAPSRLQHLVTSTDRFQPDFVECTGVPVQGRSGGGLFTRDGEVVGVCVLADPEGRRGLYTSLRTIHRLLDSCGLMDLAPRLTLPNASPDFEGDVESNSRLANTERPRFVGDENVANHDNEDGESSPLNLETINSNVGFDRTSNPTFASGQQAAGRFVPHFGAVQDSGDTLAAGASDDAATRIIDTRQRVSSSPMSGPAMSSLQAALAAARGAQVICVIRSKEHPELPGRIVIIDQASDKFVADLTGEITNQIQPTSMTVHRLSFLQSAPSRQSNDLQTYRRTSRRLAVNLPSP